MARKRTTGINVGGSSILVIFIILCLTTFATLSMVSARADLRLTEKATAATEEYYAADAEAERILARIGEAVSGSGNPREQVTSAVPEAAVVAGGDEQFTVLYSVPVGETQELVVQLAITPEAAEHRIRRLAWQVVQSGEWEPESGGFELWSGEGDLLLIDLPIVE